MVQVILFLLGIFLVAGVAYNLMRMQPKKQTKRKNVLFTSQAEPETMKVTPVEQAIEPIVDEQLVTEVQESVQEPVVMAAPAEPVVVESSLVTVFVMSEPKGRLFPGHDLIQALYAANLQYGDMSVFHRNEAGEVLFSVAQAVEPGIFNIDAIDELQCPGLLMFMDCAMMDDPYTVFNSLLDSAQQIAEALDGRLYQTPNKPWDQTSISHYQAQLDYGVAQREKAKETL